MKLASKLKVLVILLGIISIEKTFAQTNESSVTNSAAPSASSVTTGGTNINYQTNNCLLYTSPSPRDSDQSRMPSSA